MDLAERIIDIPDHPIPGVVFRDIMPMLADSESLRHAVSELAAWARPLAPDVVAAVDARGFIIGGALAVELGCGFVAFRKKDKLPRERISAEFDGEYATDVIELHTDAFRRGTRVLVHDDLMALGHCAKACVELVEQMGGVVAGLGFLIELTYLNGRRNVEGHEVKSLVKY